jgi:transposase-like protein
LGLPWTDSPPSYDRRELVEVRPDLAQWLAKWQGKYAKLCAWVEDNIEETLTYFRLPLAHHKHMKSTNMLERLNQEIKRRTHVVRIFPNAESCLRLVRALAVETHENWLEGTRYLNMEHLREQRRRCCARRPEPLRSSPAQRERRARAVKAAIAPPSAVACGKP